MLSHQKMMVFERIRHSKRCDAVGETASVFTLIQICSAKEQDGQKKYKMYSVGEKGLIEKVLLEPCPVLKKTDTKWN